jgi:L-ascorbate metabolism protein UlaG (beta-lactamase superfamily)
MIQPVQKDDLFLADVQRGLAELGSSFRMWWLGQSGFLLQYRGRHLLFDPYLSDSLTRKYESSAKPHVRMSERVIAPERLDMVDVITSTHNHTDHLDADTLIPMIQAIQSRVDRVLGVPTSAESLSPSIVLAEANETFAAERLRQVSPFYKTMNAWDRMEVDRFEFIAVPAAHDQLAVDGSGRNIYLGFIVKVGKWVIYHSGDTVLYDGMAESLREFSVDVAILPINGKVGNMNGTEAARLAKDIRARIVIPCHYDMFEFNTANPADELIPECERTGQRYRVLQQGERWSSDELD